MKKSNALLLFVTICLQFACGQSRNADQDWVVLRYIERYEEVAKEEMIRVGIPASIKLGQAILESNAGRSELARKANNHFGLKCGSTWDGETYGYEDDDYDEFGNLIESCFRKFDSGKRSFYGHSEFLQKARYRFLFTDLNPRDFESWAHGLKTAGYATNPRYATLLIGVIRRYELFRYDKEALDGDTGLGNDPIIPIATIGTISRNNDLRMVFAAQDQTPAQIAGLYRVKLKCLLKYNEKLGDGSTRLTQGQKVYLQKKRRNWRGREKYHFVSEGETMYQIAQKYGLRLSKLYRKNRMEKGTQPAIGEKLKIRGWRIRSGRTPKLRNAVEDKFGNEVIAAKGDNEDEENEYLFEEDEKELFHLVEKGDTLYSLALRYDITVEYLKKMNDMTENTISVGQRLKVK
ncbi:MAG: glucosaminidase domain-containing protein [Bacteroidota bacterium]